MRVYVGRRLVLRSLAAFGLLALAACKIVSIAEGEAVDTGFDAQAYAAGLWAEKALPFMLEGARPLAEVITAIAGDFDNAGETYGYRPSTEGSPWTFLVSGTGTVVSKNTKSRAGTLTVALDASVPPAEVTIQIGPVIRGNAVRDSLPFVSFKDFTNQLEYADVGKVFTSLAAEASSADVEQLDAGRKVSFVGAMSMTARTDKIVVTPVALKAVD